ncbi:MAG: sortase family protein [Candidatus Solibacter sp.]|nr:sortase family protein [Candidatus Solibacter sp.]
MRLVVQRALFACALLLLGYCAFVLFDTWTFQRSERRQLDALLAGRTVSNHLLPAAVGGMIGRIEIARLGISVMVVEGTGATALRRAAGHIAGTALPGQPGNIGISAHRDTFFRPLRNVRKNDVITLTTLAGEYRYRVATTRIVRPADVEVLAASDGEVLTLVTCYPFYFLGSAPDRFIVRAERVVP